MQIIQTQQGQNILTISQHKDNALQFIRLKDKEKLFAKLFVNSTYIPMDSQSALIVQPTFISLIVREVEEIRQQKQNRQYVREYKRSVILQLLQMIKQRRQNSLLICHYDKGEQCTVLDTLIIEMLRLIDTQHHVDAFGNYVQSLIAYYSIGLRNANSLTQYLARAFYQENFNPLKMKFVLRVIYAYYSKSTINHNQHYPISHQQNKQYLSTSLPPQHNSPHIHQFITKVPFFYSYGQSSQGIKTIIKPVNQHFNQPIKNQFSFVICFYIAQPHVLKRERMPGLLRFTTNKEEITVEIVQGKVTIVNQRSGKSIICEIKIVPYQIYRLIINFSPISTQLALNEHILTLDAVIKKHSQERIFESVVFGEAFEGMLFSLLMINKKVQIEKQLPFELFPYGIQQWSTINRLKALSKGSGGSKLLERVVLGYLPFSLFQNRYRVFCFDIFRKIHGEMCDNVIVVSQPLAQQLHSPTSSSPSFSTSSSNNLLVAGLSPILPLFYLSRFYSHQQYPQLLNDLLLLFQTIVNNYNLSSLQHNKRLYEKHSCEDLLQEPLSKTTFLILGNLIANLNPFYSQSIFHILLNIFYKLNDDQKLNFINHLLWNINIPSVSNPSTIKSYYLSVIKIYQNYKSIILKSKSISDIVYWVVQHFQKTRHVHESRQEQVKKKILIENIVDFQTYSYSKSQKISQQKQLFVRQTAINCCLQHYLNDSLLYSDLNIQTAEKMAFKLHNLHYSWLQNILSIVLQYQFILNISQAEESVRILLRFLMKKYSTCFYLFILKSIKRQLKPIFSSAKNIDVNKQFILSLYEKHNILCYLQFLSEKTISLDLITEIIQLHLFFYQTPYLNTTDKQSILVFIERTLRRLNDVYNCENPIKVGVKKIRKFSDQLQSRGHCVGECQQQKNQSKTYLKSQYDQKLASQSNKNRQKVLQSRSMRFQTYNPLFYLIQNYLVGQVSQQLFGDKLKMKFRSQKAFNLFKVYYQCLPSKSKFRLNLLRSVESQLIANSTNKIFLMKNINFLSLIIEESTIINAAVNRSEYQQDIKDCIERILCEFLKTYVRGNQNNSQFEIDLKDFYKTLRSASQIGKKQQSQRKKESVEKIQQDRCRQIRILKFTYVISLIQQQIESISTQKLLEQSQSYNFLIQCMLMIIEQISVLESTKHELLVQLGHDKKRKQIIENLNEIVWSCMQKVIQPLRSKFIRICSNRTTQFVLNQEEQSNKQSDMKETSFIELSYPVLKKIFEYFQSFQNRGRRNSQQKHIPMPTQSEAMSIPLSLSSSLFDIQVFPVKQGQINFVFDIIIPKLTSHFWVLYGERLSSKEGNYNKASIEEGVLLREIVEKYLNTSTVKIVYAIEVMWDYIFLRIDSLVELLLRQGTNNQEIPTKQNSVEKPLSSQTISTSLIKTLNQILQLYNYLALQCTFIQSQSIKQEETDLIGKTGLLKMVTYLVSGYLLGKMEMLRQRKEQPQVRRKQLFEVLEHSFIRLWQNIFQIVGFVVVQILMTEQKFVDKGQEISQRMNDKIIQKKLEKMSSYQQLVKSSTKKSVSVHKLSIFYLDMIQFSFFDRKSSEIISFDELKEIIMNCYRNRNEKDRQNNCSKKQIELKRFVTKVVMKPEFKESISLNGQVPFIIDKLNQINLNALESKKNNNSVINNNADINVSSNCSLKKGNNSFKTINNSQRPLATSQKTQNKQHPLPIPVDKVKVTRPKMIDISKILQKENVLEEDMRALYFFNQELQIRKFNKQWEKLWKTARLYHHPYGVWMAMRRDSNHYQYNLTKKEIKNFTYKVSKFTSNSGIKPILEARIVEPWHVIKTKLLQSKQQIAYFNDMIQSAVQASISKKHNQNNNNISSNNANNQQEQKLNMLNVWNYMWKIPAYYINKNNNTKSKCRVFNVVWIKGSIKAQGRVSINNNDQIQFWYNAIRQQDSHLTFQKFTLPFNKQLFKKWPMMMIKKVSQRRYLMKYHALEFQFIDSLLVLLHFVDSDQKDFLQLIDDVRQERIIALGSKVKANNIDIYDSGWYSPVGDWNELSMLTEKWRLNRISNLSYLMKLNIFASRSGMDLSQYPVLPWISSVTNDKQPTLRNLTKTMGALGSEERIQSLKQKFISRDPFNPVPAFHYGTHYSSPGVVFNFLVRVSPFTEYLKNLQGGRFDLPDRLFSSLISSWKSAFNEISDVRQLVPQFYYLPEILINLQSHNFGLTQSLQRVNNVDLPIWSVRNPYYFVMQFRQMLQSSQASEVLNEWIDLIFGYKQRGQQAQKNINLYYYLTYEEYNDLDEQQDEVYKRSCQAQIVHFGQVPTQLFSKPHVKRIPIKKQLMEIKLLNKYLLMNKLTEPPAGLYLQEDKKTLIIVKRNTIQHYSLQKNPISLLKANKFNLQRSSNELFYLWRKDVARITFFVKHPLFISIGYVNYELRVYNRLNGKIQKQEMFGSKINYVHLNQSQDLVLVGCQSGLLSVYQLEYDSNNKIQMQKVYEELFPYPINHISQRDGWTVVSFGTYCSVYKISRSLHYLSTGLEHYKPCVEFIRSFKCPLKIISAHIITSPLYSLILLDNAGIKCYSINGQFIKSLSCNAKSDLFIVKDNEMNEFVYFMQDERIVVMSTPDLRSVSEMEVGVKCMGLWANGLQVFDEWIGRVG